MSHPGFGKPAFYVILRIPVEGKLPAIILNSTIVEKGQRLFDGTITDKARIRRVLRVHDPLSAI